MRKKLIDKAAVVAEITKIYDRNRSNGYIDVCNEIDEILSFLDTLEVKEVNLDESARHYFLHEHISPLNEVLHQAYLKVEMQYHKDIEDAYKAGFELGIKSKGE
jgi:hypothetical protein